MSNTKGRSIQASESSELNEYVEPGIDHHYILIEGVNEAVADETIRLYIMLMLNPSLDDQFKIEKLRRNHRRCLIKFNQTINYSEIATRKPKIPDLAGSSLQFHEMKTPDTIRVTNISNTCGKEMLELYFSNSRVSGGGDIKSVKMYEYDNKALIQFEDFNKVDVVIGRTHLVSGSTLKIEKYYGPIEDEFYNEEEELESQSFSDPGKSLRKSNNNYFTIKSFNQPSLAVDRTKIILSNIQENINIQQLDFYIQLITAQSRADINEINWSLEKKGKLIIDFKREVDMSKILQEFNTSALNNLNGKPIQIETVNKTKTLVVLIKGQKKVPTRDEIENDDYIPESIPATKDLIDLYFLNKQRSGGGEIESIERKTSRYWLVVVKDFRVMKDILSRKHVVDEKPIKMFPYYENFGLPYLFKPIFDDHNTRAGMNTTFKLKLRDERLRNFCRVKNLHKKMNDILHEANAVSRFNKSESNIVYVNYVEKLSCIVPYSERIWRLKVMEGIEYFLHVYKYEKLTLSFSQWSTISKAKQLNDAFFDSFKTSDDVNDDTASIAASSMYGGQEIKYISSNCAIISVNETSTNVEISIVGENCEVDRFIVKIKDVICKAYFTFELEEKIIKFKTYLFECEELLTKWLTASYEGEGSDFDSDRMSTKGQSENGLKLNKSRRHTIDEFLSKLERDHLEMELSYGKLFQELGYTFLSHSVEDDLADEEYGRDYKEFNSKLSSSLDEVSPVAKAAADKGSQMDKIKFTLDDLRGRINTMRKKFRLYTIKSKRTVQTNALTSDDDDNEDDFDEDDEMGEYIKILVFVKEERKLLTLNRVSKRFKIRQLKQTLFQKVAGYDEANTVDDMILNLDLTELSNENLTVEDYGLIDGCTITLEFDQRA